MSPQVENIEQMIRDVPSMPVVAQKVMHMLGDPRVSNAALSEALAADQALASRILQMANSPAFGTRQKISSIANAIFILGHSTLRGVVIAVCTKGLFKNPGLMENKLWEHSLASAIAARQLAETTGKMDPDDAFVVGLLHDIGRTMFAVVYRKAYKEIFEDYYEKMALPEQILEVEKAEFGFDHNEVGSRTIKKWRLPGNIARVARRHHTTNLELLQKDEDAVAIAIAAESNLITLRLGLGTKAPDDRVDLLRNPYIQILEFPPDKLMKSVQQTLTTFKEVHGEFSL